jgi:(p)ppGpp synthase/HD superfamily hydrolase
VKDNFEDAIQFAVNAHRGQLDKGWTPYIMHLIGVWSRVREASLQTQIVALLHDTIEDTDITYEQLAAEFGTDVADAVALLTHTKGLNYELYIENIARSGNRSAILVKLADLADNSSEFRQQRLPEAKRAYFKQRTLKKYKPAKERLIKALEDIKDAAS